MKKICGQPGFCTVQTAIEIVYGVLNIARHRRHYFINIYRLICHNKTIKLAFVAADLLFKDFEAINRRSSSIFYYATTLH